MSEIKTIAVFGGTGLLGRPVVRELLAGGYGVRCLVRDAQRAADLAAAGASLVVGDLRKAADIDRTLEGCQGVYLNLSVPYEARRTDWQAEDHGLAAVLAAAHAAGIQHVVYLASIIRHHAGSRDWWVFQLKNRAVAQVQGCGLPWTVFEPSAFMENFTEGRQIRNGRITVIGQARHKLHYIAGSDYGQTVAAAFRTPSARNRLYTVQGPEALFPLEAARTFAAHYAAKPLKVGTAPLGLFNLLGTFVRPLNFLAHLMTALNEHPEPFASQPTWDELHRPTVKLADYARSAG